MPRLKINATLGVVIRREAPQDSTEIARLMALGFDAGHARRNIWALRKGAALPELSLVAEQERAAQEEATQAGAKSLPRRHLLGSIRYWPITVAGWPSVVLGPLAVDPRLRGQGIGKALIMQSLDYARRADWSFCFVSGEPDYYPKLGFSKLSAGQVELPAEIEEERLHIISISDKAITDLPKTAWKIRGESA